MPLVGVALTGVGLAGDLNGWLEGLGFLTNLFSSLTGLMFAVPFALIVVDRLGNEQEHHHATYPLQAATVTAIEAFEWSLWLLWLGVTMPSRGEDYAEQLRQQISSVRSLAEALARDWARLTDDFGPRRVEAGLPWIPPDLDERLTAHIRKINETLHNVTTDDQFEIQRALDATLFEVIELDWKDVLVLGRSVPFSIDGPLSNFAVRMSPPAEDQGSTPAP